MQNNAREEYLHAQRMGQKELRERNALGLEPYPLVLDELAPDCRHDPVQELPVTEIPSARIVGVKAAGRISAFSAHFYPLLDIESEFAHKWMALCEAHLSDSGIREPIECWEYLGEFYIQEGNKRVSVLNYFGALRIPARVKRILPPRDNSPRILAYYEFLDFYRDAGIYDIQFKKPGDYARLLAELKKTPGEPWTEAERRRFHARFHAFQEAFTALGGEKSALSPEDALLLWLHLNSYDALAELSAKELTESLRALWGDVQTVSADIPALRTEPAAEPEKKSLLDKLLPASPKHLRIAFVHVLTPETSLWTRAHEQGAAHLTEVFGESVTVKSYFGADSAERSHALLEQAVADGAELVFTTAPPLLDAALKAALRYPAVQFLNCSTGTRLSSVQSYYCRTYEGKFITGLIAGAIADNNRIGYIGSYPILGVPAAINAFALGARMTNPRAKILLEWSCVEGNPVKKLRDQGAFVISNRDIPLSGQMLLPQERFGTFLWDRGGQCVPLASPCWMWGTLYESITRAVLSGNKLQKKNGPEAINYWWGMDSGAIDVVLTEQIPQGVRVLAETMMRQLRAGEFDPFLQPIRAQDGTVITDGTQPLDALALLESDWLCDTVEGRIPEYEALLPRSRALVRLLGVHRDRIPPEAEEMQ